MSNLRPRPRLAVILAVVVASLAVIAGFATAANKPYSVVLSPSTVPAGAESGVSATFTNRTSQQQLGSANLTPPNGFRVVSAALPAGSPGTATVVSNVVELRELGLPPGQSLAVSMVVEVPCAGAGSAWTVVAKQSNNFSGPPGNNLDLDTKNSSLVTTPSGTCSLRFVTQPADAQVDTAIRGTDFDPTGPPVRVEILDSEGQRITSSSAPVSMSLGGGTATLAGTTTVNASSGVASFGDLSVDRPGTYTLTASGPGSSATSSSFDVVGAIKQCNEDDEGSGTCTATYTGPGGTTLTLVSPPRGDGTDAGMLTISMSTTGLDCEGYNERSGDEFVFDGPAGRPKTATLTSSEDPLSMPSVTDPLEVCFASPLSFAPKPGTVLKEENPDNDGTVDRYVGRLPDCEYAGPEGTRIVYAPPCVSDRNNETRTITYELPPGDPWSRR